MYLYSICSVTLCVCICAFLYLFCRLILRKGFAKWQCWKVLCFCVGLYLQIFVHKHTYVMLINSGRRRCLLLASSPSDTGRQNCLLVKQAKLSASQRKHWMALCKYKIRYFTKNIFYVHILCKKKEKNGSAGLSCHRSTEVIDV